jgi:hypothetical protein
MQHCKNRYSQKNWKWWRTIACWYCGPTWVSRPEAHFTMRTISAAQSLSRGTITAFHAGILCISREVTDYQTVHLDTEPIERRTVRGLHCVMSYMSEKISRHWYLIVMGPTRKNGNKDVKTTLLEGTRCSQVADLRPGCDLREAWWVRTVKAILPCRP